MITAAFALQKAYEVPPVSDEASPEQTVDDLEKDSIVIRIDARQRVLDRRSQMGREQQRLPAFRK